MRKINSCVFCILLFFLLSACADSKTFDIDGTIVNAKPYGILNEKENKKSGVVYEPCMRNVAVGILLSPTVVVPLWVVALELYEPVKCEGGTDCSEIR